MVVPRIILIPIGDIPGKVIDELKNSMNSTPFDIKFKETLKHLSQ